MIGRNEMLLAILDPFDRPAQPQRGEANQHILRIKLAPHPEAAAHMAFEQMHGRERPLQDAGKLLAIAMRHLGGAVQLQNIPVGIVTRDGPAGLQRNARMAADGKIELDHRMGGPEGVLHVAVTLFDDHRLGRETRRELAGRRVCRHQGRQLVERDRDLLGRILGLIGVLREDRRDRLAHIANPIKRQDRLAIGHELLDAVVAEIDRRKAGEIAAGPGRHDAGRRQGLADLDRADPGMGGGRADHAHMQLKRKRDIGREQPAAPHQRVILEPRDARTDDSGPLRFCRFHRLFSLSLAGPCGEG